MRILSWNVNGIRSVTKKGFADWLAASDAAIVGLQETRARRDQFPSPLAEGEGGWFVHAASAERAGYSGVGLLARTAPDRVETSLARPEFDSEGRVQIATWGRLVVANVYFPNGSGKDRDNSRVPYKLDFYATLFERLAKLRRGGKRILVMGDFNTAHKPIDLARPKSNRKTSGFLPEECAELDRWVARGWVDTFRHFEPGPDHYTWWSQRFGVRERNVGWRIDYVMASPSAMPFVKEAIHEPATLGSDHCPVGVVVDPAIVG